jgi:hypothetical protein
MSWIVCSDTWRISGRSLRNPFTNGFQPASSSDANCRAYTSRDSSLADSHFV